MIHRMATFDDPLRAYTKEQIVAALERLCMEYVFEGPIYSRRDIKDVIVTMTREEDINEIIRGKESVPQGVWDHVERIMAIALFAKVDPSQDE